MNEEILTALNEYIAVSVLKQPGKTTDPQARLISSGLIDSFSLVDLAIFIEQRFGAVIADTELNEQTFDSLAELVALVERRRSF